MKIAITGHRPNKLRNDYDLVTPLVMKIKGRIEDILYNLPETHHEEADNCTFITGMALGIDQLLAQIAIEQGIPFIAAIPFYGQGNMWPQASQLRYFKLLNEAKEIVDTSHGVIPEDKGAAALLMQKRNEWMVDNCDVLIAVWDGSPGGTANCVKYALSVGKTPIYINPKELQL